MTFVIALSILIEVVTALLLVGIILLQKSKGEGLGLAFGAGAGESLFGARAGNVLTRATVILGVVFLLNSLFLGWAFAQKGETLIEQAPAPAPQPAAMQTQPVDAMDYTEPVTVPQETAPATDATE